MGERTEMATPKRVKENREKGKLSRSTDLTAWAGVGAAVATMPFVLSLGHHHIGELLPLVRIIAKDPDPRIALEMFVQAMSIILLVLWPMFAATMLAVLIAGLGQGGLQWKKFKLKTEHFQPVNGIKKVFGTQALWQGTKALLKTSAVGGVLYMVIQHMMPSLLEIGRMSLPAVLAQASFGVMMLLQASVAAGIVLAVLDLLVVAKRNRKHTRMTKQEVKDEFKRTEGDPLIKSQRKSRQLEASRNRMIADIAGADVVVVNPTHVAVALKYTKGSPGAPKVVAKGSDHLAAVIRKHASEHRVPIVRDVPVARAINEKCKLGHEIPADLFEDVARILAFVLALKARGTAAGTHNAPPPGAPGASAGRRP